MTNDHTEVAIPSDIVFFWHKPSPYSKKVAWYLALRGIPYANCFQPFVMPRPDLDALNVQYRRIPVLAIGRDIYCDTRLILQKLEQLFPNGTLGADDPDQRAIQKLLERWTTDSGVFVSAVGLMPLDSPAMKDPNFLKDRSQFSGVTMNREASARRQPEHLVRIRDAFEILESTLLADGRTWIFKTEKPSRGDIEAVWPFHWLVTMDGALRKSYISPTQFPKTFAWISRFSSTLNAARNAAPKPKTVTGPQVVANLSTAPFYDSIVGEFDANDPLQLKPEESVTVHPTDSGVQNRDTGKLVALTSNEIVIEKKTDVGDFDVRIHFPRWGFRVGKAKLAKV